MLIGIGVMAAVAALVAAVACCVGDRRIPVRFLAITMVVASLPVSDGGYRLVMAGALLLGVVAVLARRHAPAEGRLHRALGGLLMAMMLLAMPPGGAEGVADGLDSLGHGHAGQLSLHVGLSIAAGGQALWLLALALRRHGGAAARLEAGAMAVMFAAMVPMLLIGGHP